MSESLVLKTSTYNFLHNGNIPNYISLANENGAKICRVNWFPVQSRDTEYISLPDTVFYRIDNSQFIKNYLCMYSHMVIFKGKMDNQIQ